MTAWLIFEANAQLGLLSKVPLGGVEIGSQLYLRMLPIFLLARDECVFNDSNIYWIWPPHSNSGK